jgi:hypothetical protein
MPYAEMGSATKELIMQNQNVTEVSPEVPPPPQAKIKGPITYSLSEVGQKASLLAGGNGKAIQTVEADVHPEDLALFSVSTDGKLSLAINTEQLRYLYSHMSSPQTDTQAVKFDSPQDYASLIKVMRSAPQQLADAIAAEIDSLIAEWLSNKETYSSYTQIPPFLPTDHPRRAELTVMAERRQADADTKREQRIAERVAGIDPKTIGLGRTEFGIYVHQWPSGEDRFTLDSPHYATLDAILKEREAQEEKKARIEANRTEKEEAFLDAWVAENGTDSEKERHSEGLLPRGEVFDRIKADLFGDRPKFNWRDHKPKCTCEYQTCAAEHDVDDATELTDSEFQSLKQLRADFPDAEVTPRIHKITRKECEDKVKIATGRVQIAIGPFTFTRSFAL